jgi:integrase
VPKKPPPKPEGRPKGTVVLTKTGLRQGLITLADGRRHRVKPPYPKEWSDAMCKERAAWAQENRDTIYVPEKKAPRALKPEDSHEPWFKKWCADREARGYTTIADSKGHYTKHIAPSIGDKSIKDWTPADMRKLCADLDAKVAAGGISWKTAFNIWGTATRMCDDACGSKVEELRVRDDNPAAGVRGPDRGAHKAKQFLYPSEVAAFVAHLGVPLLWRRLVAVAVYAYMRDGEIRALTWEDVDLEHGSIHVHQALERESGELVPTKGMQNRRVPIEAELRPLLEAMHKEAAGEAKRATGLLFPVYPVAEHTARSLRDWLRRAEVKRAELHRASDTHKNITFHDLRASGLTWMAIRGDDPLKIQQRAGHVDFNTTQGYIRTAESVREGFGLPFPRLPETLLSGVPGPGSDRLSDHPELTMRNHVEAPGIEPGSARHRDNLRSRA